MFFPDDFATLPWRQHLTEVLERMSEPSLFARREELEAGAARFVWLRAFHAPVVARIELAPEALLVAKTLRARGRHDRDGRVERRISIDSDIAARAAGAIRSVLAVPTQEGEAGKDGSCWLLELLGGGYRVAEAFSASSGGVPAAFRAAAWHLLELAGTDLVEGPVY